MKKKEVIEAFARRDSQESVTEIKPPLPIYHQHLYWFLQASRTQIVSLVHKRSHKVLCRVVAEMLGDPIHLNYKIADSEKRQRHHPTRQHKA